LATFLAAFFFAAFFAMVHSFRTPVGATSN
jgi:hypothetical protein